MNENEKAPRPRHRASSATRWLVVCLVAIFLWAYSGGIYYRTLAPLALACRLPGMLLQAVSNRSALHFHVIQEAGSAGTEFAVEQLSQLGNGGYVHGAAGALGFVVAVLPSPFDGGDYTVPPHFALVIPYWFIVALSAGLSLRSFARGRSRRAKE